MGTQFRLIGKETERGWEQAEDFSTLLPVHLRYGRNLPNVSENLLRQLCQIPLDVLEENTGLSRHTLIRARSGQQLRRKSLNLLARLANGKRCH